MKKTRILVLLLTVVMLLCATACGGGTNEKKKDNGKENSQGNNSAVGDANNLYDLAEDAKALIAQGDYASAYLLLKDAPLPESEYTSTSEYTIITSLMDKFAFVPITAQIDADSTWDDSSYSFEYDDNNRLTRIVEEYKDLEEQLDEFVNRTRITTFEHNPYGDCTTIIRNGETIYAYTYEYDHQGRVTRKVKENREYGDLYVTTYTYTYADEGYLLVEHVDYNGEDENYWYEYVYNADGSLHSETRTYSYNNNMEDTTTYTYNENGYIVRADIADNDGGTGLEIFDEVGKLLKREEASGDYTATTECVYDSRGNLIKINQEMKRGSREQSYSMEYTFTYDENGNVLSYTDEDGETHTCTYDTSGNRVSKTCGDYKWVYDYDTEGHLTKIQLYREGDLSTSATFDKFGNMLTFTNGDQSGSWSYRLVYYPDGVPECVKYGDREASGYFETFMLFM